MGIKVCKFGGSSVADVIQLKKTKEIVLADASRRFVVVSAPGKRFDGDTKITDLLYLCKTHAEHGLPWDQLFDVVVDRFVAVSHKLGLDDTLDEHFDKIRKNLETGCSSDYIASRGEYLNGVLIAALLGFDFVDPQEYILFGKRGELLIEETDKALSQELEKHENAVIPGFYGSDIKTGQVVTFSRGGSDVTGALVARAVGADVYENWTDVSGFLMADPRIVENPKPIRSISYKELRELSYMGASVLHDEAIYPARVADIPINIRNTNRPDDEGTYITAHHDPNSEEIVTGIAGSKDFTVIAIYKSLMSTGKGFVRKVLSILEDYDINFEHLPSGIDTLSVVVSNEYISENLDKVICAIKQQLSPDSIDVYKDIALIATVGQGMTRERGVSAKLFTALAEADVNVRMIDQGSSEMNIIVGVENADFERAIRAIYQAFSNASKE